MANNSLSSVNRMLKRNNPRKTFVRNKNKFYYIGVGVGVVIHEVTDQDGKVWTFKFINDNGKLKIEPQFDVQDKFHVYNDGTVCLGEKNFTINEVKKQIINWVEAYRVYLMFGFSGFPESQHKTFNKNPWKGKYG